MGELDRDRGGHDPLVPRIAELGGQQDQGGAESLAARVDKVAGRLGQQGLLGPRRVPQPVLDQGQAIDDIGRQRCVGEFHGNNGDHSGSLIGMPAPPAGRP